MNYRLTVHVGEGTGVRSTVDAFVLSNGRQCNSPLLIVIMTCTIVLVTIVLWVMRDHGGITSVLTPTLMAGIRSSLLLLIRRYFGMIILASTYFNNVEMKIRPKRCLSTVN